MARPDRIPSSLPEAAMTARFTLGLLPLLLGATIVTFFWSGQDDTSARPSASAPATTGEPDFRLDVAEWHAEFANDTPAAVKKYMGKVVELSGTVEHVGEDPSANVGCVFLKVEGAQLQDRCATIDKQPWLKVSPGSQVRIRGKVPEFGLPRDLAEAEIVEAGPNPAVVASARQLAEEYAADPKAATEKYDEKWANLDGEVVEKTASKERGVLVRLQGANDVSVACYFGERNQKAVEDIKPGTKVKVFGQLSLWKEKEILLHSTLLTEAK
jgi:hypothetical protein